MIFTLLAPLYLLAAPDSVVAIPPHLQGRYEADPRDCAIPLAKRDDDEMGQGGALVVVKAERVHWVQWDWPIRGVRIVNADSVAGDLVDTGDGGERILPVTLTRKGSILSIMQADGTTRYHRCAENAGNQPRGSVG